MSISSGSTIVASNDSELLTSLSALTDSYAMESVSGIILTGSNYNDTLSGGPGDDSIHGAAGNDMLSGDAGNDVLYGGMGRDTLSGGAGNDTLIGGGSAEDDLLIGGAGADSLVGGDGTDTASYEDAGAGVTVNLTAHMQNTGDALGDTFQSIEIIKGSQYGDTLIGDGKANIFYGLAGNNTLRGGLVPIRWSVAMTAICSLAAPMPIS